MVGHRLVPILNVSNIRESFAWFEKLGWEKGWNWGDPPCFGGVCSGELRDLLVRKRSRWPWQERRQDDVHAGAR
jgi:hypothetical protein